MKKTDKLIIDKKVLHTIAKGACIMASGGGGSYQITKYKIEQDYKEDYRVVCVNVDDVDDKGWFAGASCMSPPSALTKKTDAVSTIKNVYTSIEEYCVNIDNSKVFQNCKKFDYYHPLEVGAINSVIPIIALAQMNEENKTSIKIIDADTAGRSIPTLPLIIFSAYTKTSDLSWFPNYVASQTMNDTGEYYTGQFRLPNGNKLEEAFITLIMNQFDKFGAFCVFPMNGKTLKQNPSVFGTLTDAYNVGTIFENQKLTYQSKAEKIVDYFNRRDQKSKIVFRGIVETIETEQSGTDVGTIIIKGTKEHKGYILELDVSNENILAYKYKKGKEKKIYILGPDSICYVPLNDNIDVVDNSDLTNYINRPNSKPIELNIIAISAPKIISSKAELIHNWTNEWITFGYKGTKYIQPWLK
jgi:DUF917 family protein